MRRICKRKSMLFASLGVALIAAIALTACSANESNRRDEVAQRGSAVMSFDLDKTHHTFEQNPAGGVETVRALDPQDAEQIRLIRTHLESESVKFTNGDFSDPMSIHGMTMPGVSALSAAGARLEVNYAELSDGASIIFRSEDPVVIAAINDWFEAQVSDHGSHASTH